MALRVYKFGLLPPTKNADLVYDQMRAAHRYKNTLVEIERGRRDAVRAAMSNYDDLRLLEEQESSKKEEVRELAAVIKRIRSNARARSETETMRSEVRLARVELKELRVALRTRRAEISEDPVTTLALQSIGCRDYELRKSARHYTSAFWGTYLIVDEAADASRKQPLWDKGEPNGPRFVSWQGNGAVSVQIQRGMACRAAYGSDRRLQIGEPDHGALSSSSRSVRRAARRTHIRLRVGSKGRDPIWAEWPMSMHRVLPEKGRIKRATVNLERVGWRDIWSVDITVEMPEEWECEPCGTGSVSLDVGWRKIDGELRVAMGIDDRGEVVEERLSAVQLEALTYHISLKSIRDKNFNKARAKLVKFIATSTVPEWFAEATSHLTLWKSANRLASVVRRWGRNRWDGDGKAYKTMEAWRYHDYHIYQFSKDEERKGILGRRDRYRVLGAKLARRYDTLVLEDFDLRSTIRNRNVEDDKASETRLHRTQSLACISGLRLALTNAFVSRGGSVVSMPPENTTRTCSECGHCEAFDAASNILHTCGACGVEWDQDLNAAKVLLKMWREKPGEAKKVVGARAPKKPKDVNGMARNRFQRRKSKAAAKKAKK